jgi:aryl-alcohol dehydrogenase-like predicted oxidoreductase
MAFAIGGETVVRRLGFGAMRITGGATPGQIALGWLLSRSPVILPIPGTTSIAHLEENVAAASLRLDAEEMQAIGSAAG